MYIKAHVTGKSSTDRGLSFMVKGVPEPDSTDTSLLVGRFVSTRSRSSSRVTWTRTWGNIHVHKRAGRCQIISVSSSKIHTLFPSDLVTYHNWITLSKVEHNWSDGDHLPKYDTVGEFKGDKQVLLDCQLCQGTDAQSCATVDGKGLSIPSGDGIGNLWGYLSNARGTVGIGQKSKWWGKKCVRLEKIKKGRREGERERIDVRGKSLWVRSRSSLHLALTWFWTPSISMSLERSP